MIDYAVAIGTNLIAASKWQTVFGKYNAPDDTGHLAYIFGNGTNAKRSNAHTMDWKGNAWYAGKIKIGGSSESDEAAMEVATTDFVEKQVKGYVSEEVLKSVFATFTIVPLVAGITANIKVKPLYDIGIDAFEVKVDDKIVVSKVSISETPRIAAELLKSEKTRIVFYTGEEKVCETSPKNTFTNCGMLFVENEAI